MGNRKHTQPSRLVSLLSSHGAVDSYYNTYEGWTHQPIGRYRYLTATVVELGIRVMTDPTWKWSNHEHRY